MLGTLLGATCSGSVCNESSDWQHIVMECARSNALAGPRTAWSVMTLQLPWNGQRGPWKGALTALGGGEMRGPDGRLVFMDVRGVFWSREDACLFLSIIGRRKPN